MIVNMKNIVKRFGDLVALDYFDLEVEKGEIYGLLGPNGSGKTTAINCLLALTKYENGSVEIFGEAMTPKRLDLKRRIGLVMQEVGVYEELTVQENITYFCGLYMADKNQIRNNVDEAISFVGLEKFRKYRPKELSGGLLRRLNLACGIAHKPELIILDEPTVAVDPQSRNNILDGIKDLAHQGKTIIYTTHYMEEVEMLCNRLSIMDKGKVIVTGSSEEIKDLSTSGEVVTVDIFDADPELIDQINQLPNTSHVSYQEGKLNIFFHKGQSNLVELMHLFDSHNVNVLNLLVKRPSLNDVFLEITGKELRDNV